QTIGTRKNPAVRSIGISRRPAPRAVDFTGTNRTIADRRARQQPVTESDRVDERLECGTPLPIRRSQRAIEFALRVIAATYQRTNSTAGIINYNHRAFQIRHGRIPFSVL